MNLRNNLRKDEEKLLGALFHVTFNANKTGNNVNTIEVKGKDRLRSKELAVIPRHYNRNDETKRTKQRDAATYKDWMSLLDTSGRFADNFALDIL